MSLAESACLGTGSGREADDRQFPVGLLLVLRETGRGGGDLLPCLVTLRPVQLFGHNGDLAAVQLDLDLVGMGGDGFEKLRISGVMPSATGQPTATSVFAVTWSASAAVPAPIISAVTATTIMVTFI